MLSIALSARACFKLADPFLQALLSSPAHPKHMGGFAARGPTLSHFGFGVTSARFIFPYAAHLYSVDAVVSPRSCDATIIAGMPGLRILGRLRGGNNSLHLLRHMRLSMHA